MRRSDEVPGCRNNPTYSIIMSWELSYNSACAEWEEDYHVIAGGYYYELLLFDEAHVLDAFIRDEEWTFLLVLAILELKQLQQPIFRGDQ